MGLWDAATTLVFQPLAALGGLFAAASSLTLAIAPLALLAARRGPGQLADLVSVFNTCKALPLSGHLFGLITMVFAPYSASISPTLLGLDETEDGSIECSALISERPWLRNPFQSIHAAALVNLGEYAAGIAALCALQRTKGQVRGIVTEIKAQYTAKARGKVSTTARLARIDAAALADGRSLDVDVVCPLVDASGTTVAVVTVTWRLSSRQSPATKKAL